MHISKYEDACFDVRLCMSGINGCQAVADRRKGTEETIVRST